MQERVQKQAIQIEQLTAQSIALHKHLLELEGCLLLNSKNSSTPPSTDGLTKPSPKSLRIAGQKPIGSQPGHEGHTLRQSPQVDHTVIHRSAPCR